MSRLIDNAQFVHALGPVVPSSASPKWVSLKDTGQIEIIISGTNNTTGTASAVTLAQATAVAGTGTKTLAFDVVYANTNTATSDLFTKTTVAANTFSTVATANLNFQYVIPVDVNTLDTTNGFDCLQVTIGNAAQTTVDVVYVLTGQRYKTNLISNAQAD